MPTYGEVQKGEPLIAQFLTKKLHKFTFELHPELWGILRLREYYTGRLWQEVPFFDPPAVGIPTEPGIYMFVAAPHCGTLKDHSYIFYVGKTKDLKRRYYDYIAEQKGLGTNPREEVVNFLHILKGYLVFHYTVVPEAELAEAEALLKDNLTPPANKQLEVLGRLEPAIPA